MRCDDCVYATRDYEEYFGGHKEWFVDGCRKDMTAHPKCGDDGEVIECDMYEECGE